MRTLAAVLLLWLPLSAAAAGDGELLDAVRESGLSPDRLSLLAVDGSSGEPLLSLHASEARIPASVTKLVTAAAVLREIPLGTRFRTRLLSDAPLVDGVLRGDLVMQGGGDPSLVNETLWLLANRLAVAGVRKIAGDLVVDASHFDNVLIHPSRDTKRSEMAYDAPVAGLSFNWNAMAVTILPGERVGDPARVRVDPHSDYVHIDNRAQTVPGDSISRLVAYRRFDDEQRREVLTVSGRIGVEANPFETYRNVTHPALWSGAGLELYLNYRGVELAGRVRTGTAPDGARELASVEGRPVERLVADMNKVSSNFIAEMLVKNLGARRQSPGTMAGGLAVIDEYLKGLEIPPEQFAIHNPSGLTRMNRLSARALVEVLADMAGDFRIENEFMASLPIAGIDGTLEKRMVEAPTRGWVRAKTGYIRGAVSLAGYAGQGQGEPVLFAFLYNGPAPAYEVRALFDELSALLVSH